MAHAPAQGADSSANAFGAWRLACSKAKANDCFIWQAVSADASRKQTVLGVSVRIPEFAAVPEMQFRISPHADRAAGIGLKIDEYRDYTLPIGACDNRICEATGRVQGDVRDHLISGRHAQVAFRVFGSQHTAVLSLSGFEPALQALERRHTRTK